MKIHPLFAVPVAFVLSRRQSLVAVEWMFHFFEAKALAYVCVLFALLLNWKSFAAARGAMLRRSPPSWSPRALRSTP